VNMSKVVIKILQGTQTMLDGLTICPPVRPTNFLQCVCAKNNENWLKLRTVDKGIVMKIRGVFCRTMYVCNVCQKEQLMGAYAAASATLRVHSPDGSTFLREMTWRPFLQCDVNLKIQIRQSMRIYLKNIPAEFHPDPI